jgi:hypothetical protein
MTTIHLQVAPRIGPAHPRGSRLAAALFLALSRGLSALAPAAGARSRGPEPDVRQVRELAWSYRDSEPGFAADLSAAADRYERERGLS